MGFSNFFFHIGQALLVSERPPPTFGATLLCRDFFIHLPSWPRLQCFPKHAISRYLVGRMQALVAETGRKQRIGEDPRNLGWSTGRSLPFLHFAFALS